MASTVDQTLAKARKLIRNGDVAAARALYTEVLERFPGNKRVREALDALGEVKTKPPRTAAAQPPTDYIDALKALHQRGQLAEMQDIAAQLLDQYPESATLWNLKGMAEQGLDLIDEALGSFRTAIRINDKEASYHNNLGGILALQERHEEAIRCYREALALRPDFAPAQKNLGGSLKAVGRVHEAIENYREALANKPDFVEVHNDLGNSLLILQRYSEAEESYRAALDINPAHVEAQYNLANLLMLIGRPEEAETAYGTALTLDPHFAKAKRHRAAALKRMGRFEDAVKVYEESLSIEPDSVETLVEMGQVLTSLFRFPEAVAHIGKALKLSPEYLDGHFALGEVLGSMGNLHLARQAYQNALLFQPTSMDALVGLAKVLKDQGQLDEAEIQLKRSLSIDRRSPTAYSAMGYLQLELGQFDLATEYYNKALSFAAVKKDYISNVVFMKHCTDRFSDIEILNSTQDFYESSKTLALPFSPAVKQNTRRKLRIGYVSADLRRHPVGYFMQKVFENHDRSRFEIFVYCNTTDHDFITESIKQRVDHWRSIVGVPDIAATQLIRDDAIDVLIDLSNHTAANRLGVFFERAAPVQAHYLGHLSSTGIEAMDYWIGDAAQVPVSFEPAFSETIWRLPRLALAYSEQSDAPDPALSVPSEGPLWLGCFHNLSKITPSTIALFARVLKAIPNAKLRLKAAYLKSEARRNQILSDFCAQGIPADRLDLLSRESTPSWRDHMESYLGIDIALDPAGRWRGATTTCDALWMGTPVVTLRSTHIGSRLTAAILEAVGRPEWIADDEEGFIANVRALGEDREGRLALRATLRDEMRRSPVCDAKGLAQALEDAYEQMYERKTGVKVDATTALPFEPLKPYWALRIVGGVRVCVPANVGLMTPYVLLEQEDWFEAELPFLRRITKPDWGILDIGANHGLYALSLAARLDEGRGQVIACEPAGAPAGMLARSIELNGLKGKLRLLQLGLSDHTGTATLHIGANSELNTLSQSSGSGPDQTEQIELTTLDSLMTRSEWPEGWRVDLLKLDAEGEEIRILDGGPRFLADHDPLVMFEWKHGDQPNTGLMEAFVGLGRSLYRYVPGLDALIQMNPGEPLDGYQLNLFACGPHRAKLLREAGVMLWAVGRADSPSRPARVWADALRAMPALAALDGDGVGLAAWQRMGRAADPHWPTYENALNAFLSSTDTAQPLTARWAWLNESLAGLNALQGAGDTHLATDLLRMRVLDAVGQRAAAAQVNNALARRIDSVTKLPLDRPFVAPHVVYDDLEPKDTIDAWLCAAILEGLERRRAFSSYFTGDRSLVDVLTQTPDRTPAMDRRQALLSLRSGDGSALLRTAPLCAESPLEIHLNTEWWCRAAQAKGPPEGEGAQTMAAPAVATGAYDHVLCAGMPRSGSTWSYNVARRLLGHVHGEESLVGGYVGEGPAVDAALNQPLATGMINVLKFHSLTETAVDKTRSGHARTIVTFRTPMNAVASLMGFFGHSLQSSVGSINASMHNLLTWRDTKNSLLIPFDDIIADNAGSIGRIAAFLDLDVPEDLIATLDAETSYEAVKKKAGQLEQNGRRLIESGRSRYDPNSLLHVGHAPMGAKRAWRSQLSPDEQQYALEHLSAWIDGEGEWQPEIAAMILGDGAPP